MKSSIRVLAIGDPHFKEKNIDDMRLFVDKVTVMAKKEAPDLIVVLGDVLDTHEKINIYALTESDHFHYKLSIIAPLAIVVGNHDRVDNQDFLSEYHAFNSYKKWDHVTVADTTTELNIKGHRFILVPYVYPGRFEEALSKINDPYKCTCIFAHQEFYGAQMGAIKSEIGDKWDSNKPLVISGHIHDYQVLDNIIYTGTPLQHTFGNEKPKTVSLFTFSAVQHQSKLQYQHKRINLGLPRKRKITIKTDQLVEWTPPDNIKVKLVIKGTLEQIKSIKKLKKIMELRSEGIMIKYNIVRVNTKQIQNTGHKKTYLNKLSVLMKSENERKAYCSIFGLNMNIFKSKSKRIIIRK